MQIKYIVYYQENNPVPKVAIWQTTGDIIHPVYINEHNIKLTDVSSMGELFFNAQKKCWEPEHFSMTDGLPALSFAESRKRRQITKRDKALVQKKIYETDFLNGKELQYQCQKLSFLQRIFQHD